MAEHAYARQTRAPLMAWANLLLTALRYQAAVLATLGKETAPLERFRAQSPDATFTIVGPGGTLNDLTADHKRQIASGVCAAVNMAALAPLDFDICSTEAFLDAGDAETFRRALLSKSRLPLIWHQDRSRHENAIIDRLDREFGFYRYRRASVSIQRDIRNFKLCFPLYIAPRVFDRPNLRVSFAITGSIARLTLLGLSLGYRRIRFAGVDLGSTQYFWLEDEDTPARTSLSENYRGMSSGASRQGGAGVVPNFFEFVETVANFCPHLDFATYDPKRRSRLTQFLENLSTQHQPTSCEL